jgi:hypothetical protein
MATATHTAVEALPDRGSVKEEIESNLANAARVDKQEKDKLEPVAVIGLSLKFPQDATSPEAFWQMLLDGRSALSDIPEDRFNADHFYHHDPTRTGTV